MQYSNLIDFATQAMQKAYAPYSNFKVGAALITNDGKIFSGCNIENASYSPTICAERSAFANAINSGELSFSAIAVVGGKNGNITECITPCGVCRQFMAEFCDASFKVICWDGHKSTIYTLGDLLPNSFSAKNISKE